MYEHGFKILSVILFSYILYLKYKSKNTKNKKKFTFESKNLVLQVLVRKSLKMKPGKIAAQVGHAVIGSYKNIINYPDAANTWRNGGEAIIVLKAEDDEITDTLEKAKRAGIHIYKVYDAGRTQVSAGSQTVIALGPAPKNVMNMVTGSLKLLS